MLSQVLQPPKAVTQNFDINQTQVDNLVLFEIIVMKIVVISFGIFLPLVTKSDTTCFFLTIAIAFEFWVNKNLARTFLKAYWFVDTTTEKDRWVFQAKVKKNDTFEGIFWYSSVVYIVLLIICLLYYASRSQLSLTCALFIGIICAYLNFFAYSKIMKARNNGILQKISIDMNGNSIQNGATIQLPLIPVKSQLKQIQEQESYMYMS